jgi:signal transduction histidine kinase
MKLFYHVMIRLSMGVIVVLTAWAALFYVAMVDEINDEVDDTLEDYSDLIITRSLAGKELPSKDIGSNNQYYLREVDNAYAVSRNQISYTDSMVYIAEKNETEPARILTTIFRNEAGQYFELVVSIPTIEKKDLIEAIFYLVLTLYVALLMAIILINVWVFRKSMKPLYVLLRWLEDNRLGRKRTELRNPTNVTEFCQLNDAVNAYASHSEEVFEQQKQFIGNASHETQTPLAICRNRIELLMEDETLKEEQIDELAKTLQTLEHVTRLNKSLLLLSKIDNNQFGEETHVVMNDVLKHFLEDYKDVYEYHNIDVDMTEEGQFEVDMNEMLATMLVTNLLKNAFVHNADGGNIKVSFSSDAMEFSNTGDDAPLDPQRIFDRFYQGKKREGSTGLGLAIVHSICQQSGLQIKYEYRDGMHCFRVSRG